MKVNSLTLCSIDINSVDLRRIYNRRTQDGLKRTILCPRTDLCPQIPIPNFFLSPEHGLTINCELYYHGIGYVGGAEAGTETVKAMVGEACYVYPRNKSERGLYVA